VAQLHLDGDAGPLLDRVGRDLAGVRGRAACDDDDALDAAQALVAQLGELGDLDAGLGDAAAHGVLDRVGLLVDLLRHERRPAALVGGLGVPLHLVLRELDRVAGEVGDAHLFGGDDRDVVLVDRDGAPGRGDEGRDIGAEEVLALADADHERRVVTRGDHLAGLVAVHGEQGEGAAESRDHRAEGGLEVALARHLAADERGDDLGVGLADQLEAVGLELGAQLGEVLDDAVVDERELAAVAQVGVGVRVGRAAVGRPASVSDARAGRLHGIDLEQLFEARQLAGALADGDLAALIDHRDARGVVAAVLETPQTSDERLNRIVGADISDDSTHEPKFSGTMDEQWPSTAPPTLRVSKKPRGNPQM
jgi:hypothetical protein